MKTKISSIYYYIGGGAVFISLLAVYAFLNFGQTIKWQDETKVIYIAGHISDAHREVIENFNSRNKEKIEVKTVNLSFTKFSTDEKKELFARFLRSESDKIDIFLIDQIWVPRFAKWSESLENYITYNERSLLLPVGLESCVLNQRLVAVPLFLDVSVMYYRDDLLRQLDNYSEIKRKLENSITWEEFIELGLEAEKTLGIPFYTFQAKAYEGLSCAFVELLASQHQTLFRENKVQVNTPEARKSLQLLVDLVNKYKLSDTHVTEFEENQSYDYFIRNNGLFLRGWPNLGWHFIPDSVEEVKISNIKKVVTPHFAGGKRAPVLGGWNLMLSRFSKNQSESIEFIRYWLSPEAQKIMYEKGGFLPVNKLLYEDEKYILRHPELKFYRELLMLGAHRPAIDNYTKISGILSENIFLAISGKLTVDEALKEIEKNINSDPMIF